MLNTLLANDKKNSYEPNFTIYLIFYVSEIFKNIDYWDVLFKNDN